MRSRRLQVALAFAAIYLIWGSTYLGISRTVESIPPIFMVAARGALAGGVLYLWARMRGCKPACVREIIHMMPTAALLFGGGYALVGWAEQWVPSGPAALLNATTPVWVVVMEWVSGKRARPPARTTLALVTGVVGVGVLVMGGSGEGGRMPILPALALVGASAAWAAGIVRTRAAAAGDSMRDAAIQLIAGASLLVPASLIAGEGPVVLAGTSTGSSLVALAYLIVFGSLIGYSAWVWLLHQVPAAKVASHAYVNPLVAVIVGATLGGEHVGVRTLVAAGLIIVSVVMIITERSERVAPRIELRARAGERAAKVA